MRVSAVVLAAGRGRRMAAQQNKIFLPIAGRPLLWHTIDALARVPRVDEIILVVRPDQEGQAKAAAPGTGCPIRVVHGGEMRRDSALAGVSAARGEIVLIHDAARPFPSSELIDRVIAGAEVHGACVPVLPVTDTIRHTDGDRLLSGAVDRSELAVMQTPQGFATALIQRSLTLCDPSISDDAAAVLARGIEVWTVPGDPVNLKVTTSADLALAEALHTHLRGRHAFG